MRGVLVMALLAACSFDHGVTSTPDGPPPDMPTDVPVPPKWQIDSTSKKGVPAATFEWMELLSASGVNKPPPSNLWLMQDVGGQLEDSIGSVQLLPSAGPTYSNTVAGWTRKAVGTTDQNGTNQGFGSVATGNLNGTSYLMLVYVAIVGAPGGERSILGMGANTDHRFVSITTAPVFKGNGTGVTPALGTMNPMAAVHPVVMKIVPSQMQYIVYTDQEKITVPWTATAATGPLILIGNATTVGPAPARYLYGALWVGLSAEASDAEVKKLLEGLGWTVTGY